MVTPTSNPGIPESQASQHQSDGKSTRPKQILTATALFTNAHMLMADTKLNSLLRLLHWLTPSRSRLNSGPVGAALPSLISGTQLDAIWTVPVCRMPAGTRWMHSYVVTDIRFGMACYNNTIAYGSLGVTGN